MRKEKVVELFRLVLEDNPGPIVPLARDVRCEVSSNFSEV
jgi:hypothetical protein